MSTATIENPRKADRRRLGAGILVVALAFVGLSTLTTGALFTDTKTVTGNEFVTGTVILDRTPTTAAVTLNPMAPGDVVTAPLNVQNVGSLAFRYNMSSTTTGSATLNGQLDMTVKTGVASCTTANFGASGTVVYGPADLGSAGGTAIFGNPAAGADAGDRTLAAGANEDLCIQVSLPLSTGNAFQNLTTDATFTFNAEQVANNP
jgi:spore coat-associated protein N